jgi:hypothetical protein
MAIVIIPNLAGMFNEKRTFFAKKFAAVKKSLSGDQEIRGQDNRLSEYQDFGIYCHEKGIK